MNVLRQQLNASLTVNGEPYKGEAYLFWCPGCKTHMWFTPGIWTWNQDFEKPTVTPSITRGGCHLIMTDGQLHFGSDSTHELAGQTVSMEEPCW